MNIHLKIERLVLENTDIKTHQKHELKAAVASELEQILARRGLSVPFQSPIDGQPIQRRSITVGHRRKPAFFGRQIAEAIYRRIGR